MVTNLLTISEIAAYFGFSKEWVKEQIRIKGLPAHRIGNRWKFIHSDIEEWVRTQPSQIRPVRKINLNLPMKYRRKRRR
mgnify:FL=1